MKLFFLRSMLDFYLEIIGHEKTEKKISFDRRNEQILVHRHLKFIPQNSPRFELSPMLGDCRHDSSFRHKIDVRDIRDENRRETAR